MGVWIILPQAQGFALPHTGLHYIPVSTIPQLVKVLLDGPICELLRVKYAPESRSLMKKLSRNGPSIDLWSPLLTCLQLDFLLVITALWDGLLSPRSVHLTAHLPNPYFVSLSMRMLCQKYC